ncbi:unnamed protein product, partial [marine sediment metagenome]
MFAITNTGHKLVTGTDIEGHSFRVSAFITDGTFRVIDFTGKVPSNTKFVWVRMMVSDGEVGSQFFLAKTGSTHHYNNLFTVTVVVDKVAYADGLVELDSE